MARENGPFLIILLVFQFYASFLIINFFILKQVAEAGA